MSTGAGGHHDIGGLNIGPSIDSSTPPYEFWELQVSGLVSVLVRSGKLTVHELRRGIEGLPPAVGTSVSYYEKWALSTMSMLIERGIITAVELDKYLGRGHTTSPDVLFAPGDAVVVLSEDGAARYRKPHIRTPGYLFGCPGEVVEVVGVFEDAELAAFREIDAKQPLYRVKFSQATVWANAGLKYEGSVLDTLVVDVVQPWLMPQSAEFVHSTPAPVVKPTEGCAPHSHGDHHHHDDAEPLSDAPHARPEVEQAAVEREGVEPRFKAWAESLLRLLVDKGVVTYDAVNSAATSQAAVLGQCRGPRIVARAWADPEFKARLLANAHEAAAELGVDATNPAAPTVLHAVENTSTLHNVIVCTLCSCYPQAILGLSPQWYRSRSYRARCVRDPRSVLKEFGTVIPDCVEVRVHDSTSELRYIVVPQRPPGTEGLTEDQLASLVTRDSMIGVSFALSPDAASNLSAK